MARVHLRSENKAAVCAALNSAMNVSATLIGKIVVAGRQVKLQADQCNQSIATPYRAVIRKINK